MVTSIEPNVINTAKYTIKETCEMLEISRPTLYSYMKSGYIHPIPRKNGVWRVRFRGSEILHFWNAWV